MSKASVYKRDGKYLLYRTQATHTGTHVETEWTEDLQEATVFYYPPSSRQVDLTGAVKIRVEVTRKVTLIEEDK